MNAQSGKISCSVAVLTFNSEGGLRQCLESVKDFEEIIICDGGSTDATLHIASEYGCVVITQDPAFKSTDNKIIDFAGVRNQTLEAATKKWFLIVDSDEYLSKELVEEIATIIQENTQSTLKIFHVLRKFKVDGKIIEYAGTYPSYQPRLFHLNHVTKFARKLHERIIPLPGEVYGHTKQATIVPLEINIPELKSKHTYYLMLEKERSSVLSVYQLCWAVVFNIRSVVARWVKITYNSIFHRGNKMPLEFEIASSVYSLKLILILIKILIKKI